VAPVDFFLPLFYLSSLGQSTRASLILFCLYDVVLILLIATILFFFSFVVYVF